MPLVAYNLTGSPVTLTGTTTILPASAAPPARGAGINVTSELRNLSSGAFAALQAQAGGVVEYRWTGVAEFNTYSLTVEVGSTKPTTAALVWHVETTGNDLTGDGSVGAPFATPAGALAKLKSSFSSVEHQVDIVLGVGNFAGFMMSGVNIRQQPLGTPIGVRFLGTYVNATLTTGSPTGTVTARTSGTFLTDVTFTSFTDSSQSWTVNELRGMLVEFTSGTGSPTVLPIVSNTADTVTLLSISGTIPSIGATYAIREWGSVLNSTVQTPPGVSFFGAAALTAGNAVAVFHNPTFSNVIQITLEGIRIGTTTAPASAVGVFAFGTPLQIRRCFLGGTGTANQGTRVLLQGSAAAGSSITASIIASPGQNNTTVLSVNGIPSLTYNVLSGLATLATGYLPLRIAGQGVALGTHGTISLVPSVSIVTVEMHPLTQGLSINSCASVFFSIVKGDWLGGNLSPILTLLGNTHASLSSVQLSGVAQTAALNALTGVRIVTTGVFGTGNLYGLRVQQGTRTRIDPATSISGSGADILLSDVFATTLAGLRSLSPKSIQDNFDSIIYEV